MLHDVRLGAEATEKIREGINKASDVIKTTMGPLGSYVSLDYGTFDWPLTTNDGVTVANNTYLKDKFENIGAKYVRQASQKTNDIAGDGTTTAAVLVQALVEEGLKVPTAPVVLRREIDNAVEEVLENLNKQKIVIEPSDTKQLTDIATISCRDPKLGKLIAEVVSNIGADGVITIEDNPLPETEVERTEGLKVRGGLISPFFVNHRAFQQAVYDNVPVIVTDSAITHGEEVLRLMEQLYQQGKKEAVLIAAQIEGAALQAIIANKLQKKFDMLPIRVIAYGNIGEGYLKDICAATGATFISEKEGRKILDFTHPEAGSAKQVIAGAHEVTFVGGGGDYEGRIEELKGQLKLAKALEEESLKERVAKLQSKTASIKVGGVIDSEREEIKKRVEDAVNATKAALSDGIVSGGGSALLRASQKLEGNDDGTRVVKAACEYPLKQIAKNSAVEMDKGEVDKIIKDFRLTYNFLTGEVVDAFNEGVIDPLKVVTTALKNAVSAANLFLVTKAAITTVEETGEEL